MKKQALTLAIAAALSAPSALAAQDTSGMRYTSAAEGFYASIRVGYESGANESAKGALGGGPNDDGFASRIGVRGSNDLGNGLEGFYQWEAGVRTEASGFGTNDSHRNNLRTRVAHVGLRGAFGQVQMGSFWVQDYNWTHGSTDVANVVSGNLSYTGDRTGRTSRALEYTTPDLNGFKGAFRVNTSDGSGAKTLTAWNLAGTYSVQGFTVAGAYNVRPDAIAAASVTNGNLGANGQVGGGDDSNLTSSKEDAKAWTVRLGYSQDNWSVNGWYGQNTGAGSGGSGLYAGGSSDTRATTDPSGTGADSRPGVIHDEDETMMSLAGGISLDKVNLYALWEQRDNSHGVDGMKDAVSTVGVQYNLGANSRVWVEYAMRDFDSDENTTIAGTTKNTDRADNSFNVGLRHDF